MIITYKLPDLQSNPKTRLTYVLNKKQVNFLFRWIEDNCIISIYIMRDNEKVFLVRGRALSVNTDLLARVKDASLISGKVYIKNKYGEDITVTQDNFHTDFEMEYYDE